MTITISTEKIGQRIYVVGNTYAIKDRLKAAGCHWDGERKQWWIGTSKAAAIQSIVVELDGQDVTPNLDDARVYGKVSYTGRSGKAGTYFVVGESAKNGTPRVRLTNMAGSIDFWVDAAAVRWIKRYSPRTEGRGRWAREVWQTLSGLRSFVERARRDDPDGLGRDLEEGYYMRGGEVLAKGCAECSRLGYMCRECEHDYQ